MDKSDKNDRQTETILIALDQLSQTIDVMNSVVGRLRKYLQQQETAAAEQAPALTGERADRILH
jgi:hypothetical protein